MKEDSIFYSYRNIFKTITRDFTFDFIGIGDIPEDFAGKVVSYRKKKTSSYIRCKEIKQWVSLSKSNGTTFELEILHNGSKELFNYGVLKFESSKYNYVNGKNIKYSFNLADGGKINAWLRYVPDKGYITLVLNITENVKYNGSYIAVFDPTEMDDFDYLSEPDNYFM